MKETRRKPRGKSELRRAGCRVTPATAGANTPWMEACDLQTRHRDSVTTRGDHTLLLRWSGGVTRVGRGFVVIDLAANFFRKLEIVACAA
jgi:hypothetical protein